jgi:hypothetical protein
MNKYLKIAFLVGGIVVALYGIKLLFSGLFGLILIAVGVILCMAGNETVKSKVQGIIQNFKKKQ